jgi:pimeloyl-ACP methyl ester carboxylesterase
MLLGVLILVDATASFTQKLKVLCLHGYGQNGDILRDRSGGFRRALKKSQYELFYPSGPFGCTANGEDEATADEDVSRRAWWRGPSTEDSYMGWHQSRSELLALWERECFDAVFGFSQGSAAAAILCAEMRPQFGIFISGFVPRDHEAAASLLAGVQVPTLHVIGGADSLVVPARSHALVSLCQDPTVVEHEGGHMIPSGAAVRAQVRDFLGSIESA